LIYRFAFISDSFNVEKGLSTVEFYILQVTFKKKRSKLRRIEPKQRFNFVFTRNPVFGQLFSYLTSERELAWSFFTDLPHVFSPYFALFRV